MPSFMMEQFQTAEQETPAKVCFLLRLNSPTRPLKTNRFNLSQFSYYRASSFLPTTEIVSRKKAAQKEQRMWREK